MRRGRATPSCRGTVEFQRTNLLLLFDALQDEVQGQADRVLPGRRRKHDINKNDLCRSDRGFRLTFHKINNQNHLVLTIKKLK